MSAALLYTILAAPDAGNRSGTGVTPPAPDDGHEFELVARIRAGDEQAFRELMEAYFLRLARFAYGIVGSRDTAHDIAQDVLAGVWQQRERWNPEHSLKTYLFGAARNRALNDVRHRAVRTRLAPAVEESLVDRADAFPDIHDQLTIDAAVARLHDALARLPERRRTAVRLRYEEGLTYPVIAKVLGVSVKSAEQLVALTVRALRKELLPLR